MINKFDSRKQSFHCHKLIKTLTEVLKIGSVSKWNEICWFHNIDKVKIVILETILYCRRGVDESTSVVSEQKLVYTLSSPYKQTYHCWEAPSSKSANCKIHVNKSILLCARSLSLSQCWFINSYIRLEQP